MRQIMEDSECHAKGKGQEGTTAVLWGLSHVGVSTEYGKDLLSLWVSNRWQATNGREST